jgi:hypothetical protein
LTRFLLVKYISLALNSARALLLAALLGPVSYGILGTLVLSQQYLSYLALGVREGLTVKLAHVHGDAQLTARVCSSALFFAWCVGALVLGGSVFLVHGLSMGNSNWVWVGVIACLSITNEVFINIYRDQGRILRVALLDVLFNCAPLFAALLFFRDITVRVALESLALGMLLSVAFYASSMPAFLWRDVNLPVIGQLLATGIPMALLSFAMTSLTAVFIFSANAMHLGATVGLLVFANSICLVLLFGLNMAAWAATSTSMKRLHSTNSDDEQGAKTAWLTMFFRIGVIFAAGLLLCLKIFFIFALGAYSASEVFAVYLCLLQVYGLLLYREINYLAVRSRTLVVASCYGTMLLFITGIAVFVPSIGLVALLRITLLLMFMFSLGCVWYCRHLGFVDRNPRAQVIFLLFPIAFAIGFWAMEELGAAAVALIYAIFVVGIYKDDLRRLAIQFSNG